MKNAYTNFDELFQTLIGLDSIINPKYVNVLPRQSFPPYNITKDGDKYSIVLALAGYGPIDIEIVTEKDVLTIGTVPDYNTDDSDIEYIRKGIAKRTFKFKINLMPDVVVDGATFLDGMLTVNMHLEVPEEKKPKKIAITHQTSELLAKPE